MSSTRSPLLRYLAVLATAGLAAGLVACGDPAGPDAAPPPAATASPAPTVVPIATDEQVQRPARHDVSCIDRTGSVPEWFVRRALRHVAARIEDTVTGPMRPAYYYLRSMSATSYAPEAEIATVELSAVPVAPRPPPLSENPFDTVGNSAKMRTYEQERQNWLSGLAASRAFAHASAERVRSLSLAVDNSGTDVLGCLLRAPDLLGADGDRSLFVASDLVPSGPQQDARPRPGALAGVEVTVGYYCADQASACAQRVDTFVGVVRDAGAERITVVDPQNLGE